MRGIGKEQKNMDRNTRQYIWRMRMLQLVFLVFMCVAFTVFAKNVAENSRESLREVALKEVRESMRETVDNLAVHIDMVRSRIKNEADAYLAELSVRMKNGNIHSLEDILAETTVCVENKIGNSLQILYTDVNGTIYHINVNNSIVTLLSSQRKQEYIDGSSVSNIINMECGEIILFIYQGKLDMLVKEEIHDYIHAEHYEGNQYVWVNEVINLEGGNHYAIRRVHPNLKESEGQYLSTDMQDSVGNYPYLTELEGIRENGHVFHSYFFKNITDENVTEKFSYAIYYEPFNWIIATGETLEEVYEYSSILNEQNSRQIVTLMCVFIGVLLILFGMMLGILEKQAEQYREQMMKQAEVLEDMYTTMSVGLLRVRVLGEEMTLIRTNPKVLELFGVSTEEEFLENRQMVVAGVKDCDAYKLVTVCKELKNQWDSIVVECYVTWKDGSKHLLRVRNTLVEFDGKAKIIQRMCQDITEERRLQEEAILQAEEKATLDPMTQIKNKKAIEMITRTRIKEAVEKKLPIAVGFVDIDNFRNYNTLYGHLQGDEVIKYVASVLKESVKGDVGRNGGDEFTFCVLNASYEEIEESMKNMHKKLNTGIPVLETGEIIPTPCSIGVVIEQNDSMDYEMLVKSSDEAMYRAKEMGKNTYYILQK